MLTEILKAFLVLGIMGLLFGGIIGAAGNFFRLKDARKAKIIGFLPGSSCGECGYADCATYAAALLSGGASCDRCPSVNGEDAAAIAALIGAVQKEHPPMVAHIRCHGSHELANKKYIYYGMNDCDAASRLLGGYMKCQYGCLGFGNCVKKCPQNAISIENGVAVVDSEGCTGCGRCLSACPKGVIELVPKDAAVFVSCSNKDQGTRTVEICNIGCIGCKICETNCPEDAIHVKGNVSVIDYEKCVGCGLCAEKCPRNLIEVAVKHEK